MFSRFTNQDRLLLSAALLVGTACAYLLWSAETFDFNRGNLEKIGAINSMEKDVRTKHLNSFQWTQRKSKSVVYLGDKLFTGENSFAEVQLQGSAGSQNLQLQVQPNTLIFFEKEGKDWNLKLAFGEVVDKKTGEKFNEQFLSQPLGVEAKAFSKTFLRKKTTLQRPLSALLPDENLPKLEDFLSNPIPAQQPASAAAPVPAPTTQEIPAPAPIQASVAKKKPLAKPKDQKPLAQTKLVLNQKTIPFDPQKKEILRIEWSLNGDQDQPTQLSSRRFSIELKANPKAKKLLHTWTTTKNFFEIQPSWIPQFSESHFSVRLQTSQKNKTAVSDKGRFVLWTQPPILNPIPVVQKNSQPGSRAPSEATETQKIPVQWSSVPVAKKYELQIANDQSFRSVSRQFASVEKMQLQFKKTGEYHARVRALDSANRPISDFSAPQPIRFEELTSADAPLLVEPRNEVSLVFQPAKRTPFWLSWQDEGSADAYRLEFAKDSQFQQKVFSQKVTGSRFLIPYRIPHGQYFWRVRVESEKARSSWSEARAFSIFMSDGKQ